MGHRQYTVEQTARHQVLTDEQVDYLKQKESPCVPLCKERFRGI